MALITTDTADSAGWYTYENSIIESTIDAFNIDEDQKNEMKQKTKSAVSSQFNAMAQYIIDNITYWITFRKTGTASVATKVDQSLVPKTGEIKSVTIYSDIAPSGSDLIVDVNINGISVFSPADRPTIPSGSNTGTSETITNASVTIGDRISVDIDQVGSSTSGGSDLLVLAVFG